MADQTQKFAVASNVPFRNQTNSLMCNANLQPLLEVILAIIAPKQIQQIFPLGSFYPI
nr:hypothetical protein [Sulfuriferula sp. AH1]